MHVTRVNLRFETYAPFAFVTRRRASTPSPRERAREMADVADAFDAALNLEESHLDEGWEDGLRCVLRGRGHAMRLFSSERARATAAGIPVLPSGARPRACRPDRLARDAPTRPHTRHHDRRDGEKLGSVEGRQVGFAKGFEVGQEMGFYAGCHAVWTRCVRSDPDCFGERARRSIDAFGEMLGSFPIHDPLNEEILEILNAVRGKFKTIVALMGMHKEYAPDDAPAGASF